MPKVIYISGPMTGLPNFNREEFNSTQHALIDDGFAVLNPACLPDGLTDTQYMAICLPMVMASECIYMLRGWKESKGAIAEHALAEKLGLTVIYEQEKRYFEGVLKP